LELVLATRNPHKLREFAALLAPHQILPLPDEVELPPETGETFSANAAVKARVAAEATGRPALADDSGIAATGLGGRPGVRSARYAGEGASDEENLAKLLREVPDDDRRVAYVCALAYAEPGESRGDSGGDSDLRVHVLEERCEGVLAHQPRGDGGFGYDPAFVPVDRDDGRTMAELTPEEKDAISHRGRAARAFLAWLEDGGRR
jgi:XTP/dITP diphosphohydrolase